jgi:NAD-dependent dihydropyrimidine dehydrogenase PreA subunit
MPYVIGEQCIDRTDRSCVEECPVDCIYEGARKLYINPMECIDCGACEPLCPVQAISFDRMTPDERQIWIGDNHDFFTTTLPGRAGPIGAPGGADMVGRIGIDTPLVTSWPAVTKAGHGEDGARSEG